MYDEVYACNEEGVMEEDLDEVMVAYLDALDFRIVAQEQRLCRYVKEEDVDGGVVMRYFPLV